MAEFIPFHGLRYNVGKVALADVLAPPYDVIKGDHRARLAARSAYNVVGVELPEGEGDTRYENAARVLDDWKAQGILVRDDPTFYIYEQEFAVPGAAPQDGGSHDGGSSDGVIKKRRGVLGALRLEEFGSGVQPHEHTLSGPKQDRLQLLRATRTNTSPIFGLFNDNDGWVDSVVSATCAVRPICEARDADGITHRLWRLDDDESINCVVAALEDEPILIADGHHRYETALNYRNERRGAVEAAGAEWTGAEPDNYVMMMIVSTSDDGLIVLPTHRLVKGVDAGALDGLLAALGQYFEIEEAPAEGTREAAALLRRMDEPGTEAGDAARLGLHLKGRSYSLRLKPGEAHLSAMDAERSAAYNGLDVTILHTLILERHLGIGPAELAAGGHVAYTIDAAEAFAKVDAGDYDAAFLLRSTPVQQVQQVAAAGDKMPQKSTYFYPKLITGLVLRPLD